MFKCKSLVIIIFSIYSMLLALPNYSLDFDGENDWAGGSANSSLDVSGSNRLTLSAWVKVNDFSNPQMIFVYGDVGIGNQYSLSTTTEGLLYFVTAGANGSPGSFEDGTNNTSITPLNVDRWHHVAVSYDGDAVKIYLDGTLDFQHNIVDNFPQNTGSFSIGSYHGSGNYFNGNIDEVSVWNVARTQEELQSDMYANLNGSETGLVGHWNFNEGVESTLNDISGNGNVAQVYVVYDDNNYRTTWSTDVPNFDPSQTSLIIAAVIDLTVPEGGSNGKAVVLQALDHIPDLSVYGLGVANNGGGTDGQELTFPVMSLLRGDVLWFVRSAEAYANYFGSEWLNNHYIVDDGSYSNDGGTGISMNGDDGIELFKDGNVVDVFGYIGLDGTDEDWEYMDAWAKRNCDALTPSVLFNLSDWEIPPHTDPQCSDDSGTNDASTCPFPLEFCALEVENFALSFDGIDDFVSFSDVTFGGDFTFLGFINFASADATSNVFINGEGSNFIRLDGSGSEWKLGYNSESGSNHIGNSILPINEWSHVGVVRENGVLYFYVNGRYDGQFEEGNSNINFNVIGMRDGSWDGLLDDFSLWTVALNQSEIQDYMSEAPFGAIDGLYASWDFNDGSGTTLSDRSDLSGGGENGEISGATWVSGVPLVGCTDEYAENYNSDAVIDNGSCRNYPYSGEYSLDFDGIDDWVDTGIPHTDLSGASSLTFEFSFKRRSGSSDGQYQGLITSQTSGESQLGIRITDQNYLELGFKNDNSNYNDAIYNAETIDFDVWYNFYVELSNNQVVWYRDGVQVETDNVDFQSLGQESDNVPPLSIGRGNTVYGEYFDGLVNEVVITIGSQNNDLAYWDFNTGNGSNLFDLSGNQYHGIINGAYWNNEVPIGDENNYLNFDGVDDYVEVPYSSTLNSFAAELSVSVYFKVTGKENTHRNIITNGNVIGFALTVSDNNKLRPHVQNQLGWLYFDGNTTIELDVLYHAAFVYDGQSCRLYLNGIEDGISTNLSGNIVNNNGEFLIGKMVDNNDQNFPGIIDELSIWDVAITEEQIQTSMNYGLTGGEQGLVGFWNFNVGEGNILPDIAGNNNGIIYGAEWGTEFVEPFFCATNAPTVTSGDSENIVSWLPPNSCQDFAIDGIPYSTTGNNTNMGDDWIVSSSQGDDVAYLLTVEQSATYDFTLCSPYTNYDTKLSIFNGCNGQEIFYNDDWECEYNSLYSSLLGVTLDPGIYYVVVDGYNGQVGDYELTVDFSSGNRNIISGFTFEEQLNNEIQKMQLSGFSQKEIDLVLERHLEIRENESFIQNSREVEVDCGTFNAYRLYNASDNSLITETTELTYTHAELTNGAEYCYYVTVLYAEGESASSPESCGTPFGAPEIAITPDSYDFGMVIHGDTLETSFTISNNGDGLLEWSASFSEGDADDLRDLSNQMDPQTFRSHWQDQMVGRQIMTLEQQNEMKERMKNSDDISIQRSSVFSDTQSSLLSGDVILPPEAHRNRNGSTMITVLMDNEYYAWNTMDALANYYTDYELYEVYTNWDPNTLESEIQGSDLVLIPFGHWFDNYDMSSLEPVLSNYVESGGGLLFTGCNYNGFGGFFEEASYFAGSCCGNGFNESYYDADHPIMVGTDGYIETYEFTTTYLPNTNNVEVVFNLQNWWGYDYDHVIFSAEFGSGRVTVLGSTFQGWYEDEAMMLSNAVEYTAGTGGFGIDPVSGVLDPGESTIIGTQISSENYDVGEHQVDLIIDSNDPNNNSLTIPIAFTIDPGEMVLTPEAVSLELYVNEGGAEEIVSLTNNGGYPIEWTAELQMDADDVRDLSNQMDPQAFRAQWRDQMIERQVMPPERRAELENRQAKYSRDSFKGPVMPESPENALLCGDFILPPEAHRSRNGSTMITVLMDNDVYTWNTLDALSYYYTDYELNEVYTNWDPNILESAIQGTDLVLIPYGHWMDNYYDYEMTNQVLLDYVETGGGVLFTGYNFNEYGDLIDGSGPYTYWCCGYSESNSQFYDEDHPIMEGVTDDGIVDIYSFAVSSLSSDNNVEVVFNNEWWNYVNSYSTFSREIGSGRVTVLGSYFSGWYDDEAMMLANAVEYTAGAGGFGIDPESGMLAGSETAGINLMYSTYDMVGEYTGNLVLLTDLEDNPEVNIPVSITVLGAPDIMVEIDTLNFGEVISGDTVSAGFMVNNNGTETLEITSVVTNDPDGAFVSEGQTGSLEPGEELYLEVSYMPTTVGPGNGTVVISSNDPNEAEYSLPLVAEVIPAPVFVLSEESITVDMVSYVQDTTELYISNFGDGALEYSVEIGGDELYETETFTKEDYADWTLEENQHRLSETVWLTRADQNGLFNAYNQGNYDGNGPYGTQWRWGATETENGYEYTNWQNAVNQSGYNVRETLDEQQAGTPVMSLYFEETGEYFDVTFTSWTCCNNGGGFSWEVQQASGNLSWLDVNIVGPGQTEVHFRKENYADPNSPENQDRITDDVWLTRQSNQGLYNAYNQGNYDGNGPYGTQWRWGSMENNNNNWDNWRNAVYQSGTGPRYALDGEHNGEPSTMSMHIIDTDLYFEFTFTWWQCCQNGGGFEYTRIQVNENGNPFAMEAGLSDTAMVSFDPGDLPEGTYTANLYFTSNDPQNRQSVVPVTMNLTGAAEFNIWPEEEDIDFGQVYIGAESFQDIYVWNTGTGLLTVDAMMEGEYYTVEPTALEIAPGETGWMIVHYTPLAEGAHGGSLMLTTNDENYASYTVAFTGEGLTPPIVGVSTDSIGLYIPTNDTLTRTFQVTNTGGSDLYWSIGSGAVGADDMRNGSSETVSEFRSRWANAMIPAQQKTPEIEQEIQEKMNANQENTVQIHTSTKMSPSGTSFGKSGTSLGKSNDKTGTSLGNSNGKQNTVAGSSVSTVQTDSRPAAVASMGSSKQILPPEAHRSRDGNTMITILMDNEYYAWNTMNALSMYYDNYSINEVYTNWTGQNLQDSLVEIETDVLLVPFGHFIYEYETNGMTFGDAVQDFVNSGGRILFTGYNDYYTSGAFGYGYGQNSWCCYSTWYNYESNWDEDHPVMVGVGSEYEYSEFFTSYLDPWDSQNETVESIMNLNPIYDYENYHGIFANNVGQGSAIVIGSSFWDWTDDEARVLANAMHYLGDADFVSFEPESGTLAVGESIDVVVSYESVDLSKGEYTAVSTLISNDIYNSSVQIVHNMRVVGTPDLSSQYMNYDDSGLDFGEVWFENTKYDYVEIMNYDSNTLSITSELWMEQLEEEMFQILDGSEMELLPFTSDTLIVSATGFLDEGYYTNRVLLTTSHPDMPEDDFFMYATIVPRAEPIITDITDVHPDQGGRVTLEFTRSYFDGWFGNQRTELYTIQLNDNGNWTSTNSTVAYQDQRYYALVHTLQDSGLMGDGMTEFRVVAGMDEGTFFSASEYGYSTDDLAPGAPVNVATNQSGSHMVLNWEHADEDYHHFSVYRHDNADFEPHADNHIGDVAEMTLVDSTAEWFTMQYYIVTATDFGGNVSDPSETVEGYIHVNFAPVIDQVDPQVMNEDQVLELVLSASDQNEEDVLTYTASSSSEDVAVAVNVDTLTFTLTENWYGSADIMVSVTDSEFADTTEFTLTVNSVNDAPEVFTLLGPEDGSTIVITPDAIAQGTILHVNWSSSLDVDADDLSYGFALYGGSFSPETPSLIDTVVSDTVVHLSYESLAQALGFLGESVFSCDWTVFATDGMDTTMSNDIWNVTLDASGVLSVDGELLPTEFALHQNYPNPFNPTTTLRYDLPQDSHVLITIYDIRGRKVKTLINENQNAGYRITQWNATNDFGQPISAGMYIYAIQAGDFRTVKKMILLK